MKLLLTIILLPAFILLSCKQSEDEPDQTHLENGQKTSQQENTDSSQQANKPDQIIQLLSRAIGESSFMMLNSLLKVKTLLNLKLAHSLVHVFF